MKKTQTIKKTELEKYIEENPSDDFVWYRTKIKINGVLCYLEDIVSDKSTKSTAQSLIKKEAEYDQNRFLVSTMEGAIETSKVSDVTYDWLEYSKTQNTKKTYEEKDVFLGKADKDLLEGKEYQMILNGDIFL